MRFSTLFTKTRKEAPKDEVSRNASLLIRGGFIHKEMAGVYSYLPLGLRVLRNIERIIREEMNAIGGQEVLMTTLQDPDAWKKTDRWSDERVDNWFKTELKNGAELGIANTHEEPLTTLLTHFAHSYKDLPLYIYQIQTKFRNELRAKSGIMRCREFLMKDMYSFSRSEKEFKDFYEQCAAAYEKIFTRVGIGHITYRTAAAGGSFTTSFTDEFQTLAETGEDTIYVDEGRKWAVNKEIYTDENLKKLSVDKKNLVEKKSIEVGNIFPLGTRYTEALGLSVKGEDGKSTPVFMGSYGIGLGRLMGTVVEALSDDKGIVWPKSITPFSVHLMTFGKDESVRKEGERVYARMEKEGVEVLYDDREVGAGMKFGDADLLGIPFQVVVSEKTLAQKDSFEVKERKSGESKIMNMEEFLKLCNGKK